jgi:Ca2+/H+ antiporter, TMEM165/GDT1 family
MAAALFAFLAAALAGIGARDQLLVAGLVARLGRRVSILAVALGCAGLSTAAAAWAGAAMAGQLNTRAGMLLAALALGLAAIELALLQPKSSPREPTRSLGAAGIVLLAVQITDATRFLVFAIAIAAEAPQAAALGGLAGSLAVVTAGWLGGAELLELWLRPVRRVLAAVPVLAAGWLIWQVAVP